MTIKRTWKYQRHTRTEGIRTGMQIGAHFKCSQIYLVDYVIIVAGSLPSFFSPSQTLLLAVPIIILDIIIT